MIRYKLFNPITGTHETINTIEELKLKRQELIDSWMLAKYQEAQTLHSVIGININENNDELWISVDPQSL